MTAVTLRKSRRAGLSRETVLREALALVDQQGVDALRIRPLAARLGVTPMAIYNHVPNKQALLDGVAELLAGEIEAPAELSAWDERLCDVLRATRRVCLTHPNAVPLLQQTRSTAPALLRPTESALGALANGGLDAAPALEAWSALIALTMGHVSYQINQHLRPAESAPIPSELEFPHIAAAISAGPFDFDAAFDSALDALLAGLRANAATVVPPSSTGPA